jgi:phenylpropionate dioxygenase-like ring-hydroxylating dioxygenase large terminal subunit
MSITPSGEHGVRVTLRPGEARCPGPSTRDLILGDSTPSPAPLLVESYEFEGDADVAFEEYTSAAYAAAEHEHMWSRTWQWACRDEHIPEPGDYYVYDIGDRSALIVRQPDGSVRAFHNACLHRGTQLKPPATNGYSPQLRCPFHGWTWTLEGELSFLPCEWDFPHVERDDFRLPQVRTGSWGGFVFVNFDDDPEHPARSLDEYLGVLPEHFAEWDLARRYVEVHVRKRLPANWKASAAAFLEAYHILETHSQSILTAGDANAQYDVFGDNVSRFIHTIATTSPHVPVEERPDEQRLLEIMMARKDPGQDVPEVPPGQRARDVYARHMQTVLGEAYDNDFSTLSVTETIDSIEYFLFPNAFFFPGLQIPLCYRFRPDGPDPDRCVFEVLFLRPHPRSGIVPLPAEPVDLDVHDSYTTVPGMPGSLGAVLDQDTANLAAQTRGFKASKKRGQTLGNYQEIRARHLHSMVRRYVAEGSNSPSNEETATR